MPSLDAVPRTLDTWLQQLDRVRLPIAAEEQFSLQRALGDERLSLRDVATQVQRSPTFVLALIREASQGRSEPLTTTEMALRRLGLARAASVLRGMDVRPGIDIPQPLRQLQLVSLHAMQQANGLFVMRLARLAGEIHLASLLFLAPLWPLAEAHPALFREWARRVLQGREATLKVEQELFGISLRSLCLALAEHWCLPEWIELGYRLLVRDKRRLVQALHIAHDDADPLHQQQRLDAAPALRRWLTQPANTLLLANGIAIAAHSDWNNVHSLRWLRLTALYLDLRLDAVKQHAHQQAVISARLHAQPSLWHPAQMLVWCEPGGSALRVDTAGSRDIAAWHGHCARLRQPATFRNAVQLLDCARDALAACGIRRLLMLVANRTHSQLLVQQSHGLSPAPTGATIACADNEILRRLLQKPARLLLDAGNFSRLTALLPSAVTNHFSQPPVFLQSLASHGRVRLVLIAEWPTDAPDAEVRETLAQTVRCIEQALTQIMAPSRSAP